MTSVAPGGLAVRPSLREGEAVQAGDAKHGVVGDVVFLLPGREFGMTSLSAVRGDQPGAAVAAVSHHSRVADGILGTGQPPHLAVVAVAGQPVDRPRRRGDVPVVLGLPDDGVIMASVPTYSAGIPATSPQSTAAVPTDSASATAPKGRPPWTPSTTPYAHPALLPDGTTPPLISSSTVSRLEKDHWGTPTGHSPVGVLLALSAAYPMARARTAFSCWKASSCSGSSVMGAPARSSMISEVMSMPRRRS